MNVNDFLDLLSNKNIKTKFADTVARSISTKLDDFQTTVDSLHLELAAKDAVITRIEHDNQQLTKLVNDLSIQSATKLDSLQATIDSLCLELVAKDAVITRIEQDNQRLTKLVNDLSAQSDELLQETKRDNLIISGIAPSAAEAVIAGTNNTSSQATVVILVDFCYDVLQLAHIKQEMFLSHTSCHSQGLSLDVLLHLASWWFALLDVGYKMKFSICVDHSRTIIRDTILLTTENEDLV